MANSTSSAALPEGRHVTAHNMGSTASLNLLSHNNTDSTTEADGGATVGSGGTGVGVGVAVNVANVTNEAYIGAGAVVSADGVSVKATMAEREVKFTAANIPVVDTAKDTLFVGLDSGLKTGDKRLYFYDPLSGATGINGLTLGNTYFVRVEAGGKIKLYDSYDHAKAGGKTGLADLKSAGSGSQSLVWFLDIDHPSLPSGNVDFEAGSDHRVVDLAEGANLDTGDAVHYSDGGGSPTMGLNTTDTYYVINLDNKHYELAASRQDALDGKAITLTDAGNTNQKFVESTDSFRAEGRSGAGGGDIGVAGSVGINIAHVHTRAIIGYDADPVEGSPNLTPTELTLTGGDVDLEAESVTDNFVDASPTQSSKGASGSSVGVGASFALNIALNDTIAEIENGETLSGSTGHFIVTADSDNTAITTAENGASGGGTQIGAGVAIAVVENTTRARIGSGAGGTITLGGELKAEATHADTVHTATKGEAAGDGTAVGASVALNIVTDDTLASVARSFSGATDITVASTSRMDTAVEARGSASGASTKKEGDAGESGGEDSRNSEQETNHQADVATQRAGTSNKPASNAQSSGVSQANSNSNTQSGNSASSGGTSVAASVAVNYMNVHNTAEVTGGVSITGSGSAEVIADSDADGSAQGLSTSTNTKANTGVAAAVGVNIALVHNTATVDDGVTLQGGDVAVKAEMVSGETNTFVVRALSGGVAKNTAIGGSVALNVLDVETDAQIGASAHVTATTGDLDVAAESHNEIQNISGGAALSTSGGTGVGVAVSINIVSGLDTNASVGHDAVLNATNGSVHITADASLVPKTETLPVIGSVGITSFAAGVAASKGGAAIGGSSSVDVYLIDTHAYVEHDATITAHDDIMVSATDSLTLLSAAGGIGASSGSAGVGIGLDVGVIIRHTTAHVDEGATLTATNGNLTLEAQSNDDITSIAATFGVSTSSAGVAASVGVMVLTTETRAYTEDKDGGDAVHLTAGGDVSVTAQGDLDALMIGGSVGAGSSAGVGVANTTLVHTDTVEARIGAESVVHSAGSTGVTVSAMSEENIIALTAAGGAASTAGVAVAPTILVLSEDTTASIGAGATANAETLSHTPGDSSLAVTASDTTSIVSVAGSVGVGGTAGVAAGVDVLSLIKHTNAFMDSGVTSHVDGDITVSATSHEEITSVAAGIAVGGTAGVGVNAGVHVLNITTRAFIGDDPDESVARRRGRRACTRHCGRHRRRPDRARQGRRYRCGGWHRRRRCGGHGHRGHQAHPGVHRRWRFGHRRRPDQRCTGERGRLHARLRGRRTKDPVSFDPSVGNVNTANDTIHVAAA